MQFPIQFKSFAAEGPARSSTSLQRIGYDDNAASPAQIASLESLFPNAFFESIGSSWPMAGSKGFDILILGLDAGDPGEIDRAVRFLKTAPARCGVLVALRDADVPTSRILAYAGAADVIPVPATDTALALGIERLLARDQPAREPGRKSGQVVALLKAGGGVGATSLGVQAVQQLANQAGDDGRLCFADLDLQFGSGALYFDLENALTVTDCVAVGDLLNETQFATALSRHQSGVRVLAAPRDVTPLDVLTPKLAEALVNGLRRDFALTVLDLPSVWTAWTNQVLQLADRIVLVTKLSVPHVHMVRRQLAILAMQHLDRLPITLVLNAVNADQQGFLSIRSAEKALGRSFQIVVPEDGRTMGAATNQGLSLADIRRNTKLEKFVEELAKAMAVDALVAPAKRR
jgi:pilus assembly protein CpaE